MAIQTEGGLTREEQEAEDIKRYITVTRHDHYFGHWSLGFKPIPYAEVRYKGVLLDRYPLKKAPFRGKGTPPLR